MKDKDNKDRIISTLEKMLRELKAGYEPGYLLVLYPLADKSGLEVVLGYTTNDISSARRFDELLGSIRTDFRQRYALELVGLDSTDLEGIKNRFEKDIEAARERAIDGLKRDKPVKDLTEAQKLLRKILSKEDDHD